ncbi:hypothetical protein B0J11DRAFT_521637 [Dendryphion nanum]|uniref:Glucose-methanol-choline oxidoreductase N-terminal domain-containing protein n=1 Tax=Dendryphion nanum TaxID=256645 RepID=A0A9P9IRE6_9PLEO|nr:hypothetical protein B0J11DRAFT_521637 [Dendryphion nanum]
MERSYDFVVVGAGASGATIASRLAHTAAAPSILLIEAGSSNLDVAYLDSAKRFKNASDPNSPMNWGYKTTAQHQLAGQEIDYSRGRGLGGSTAINFYGWTIGPKDDYDEWANLVGNERFAWQNVKRILRRIENLDTKIPQPHMRKYLDATKEDHSESGNLALSYGEEWRSDIEDTFIAAEQSGHRMNHDINNGDPIGMGMGAVSISNGLRQTSATAYLYGPPSNISILTDAHVSRILFDSHRAIGVETVEGRKFLATKEVILSAGAINSPQILMLSGIGSTEEIKKHNIEVIKDLAMVGKNLQDHCFAGTGILVKKDPTLPYGPPQTPTPMAFLKLPGVSSSSEFQELPDRIKRHLQKATVPAIELASNSSIALPGHNLDPSTCYVGTLCINMNPQSRGTLSLRSSNPRDKPLIDPKFLTHPFDRRVLIEGMREAGRILSAPVYAQRTVKKFGPKNESDEGIFEHIKGSIQSAWHMAGTAAMGLDAKSAVVDSKFKVFGVEGLRVVDMSVCPFVINAHVQSTAYIVGEIAADVIAEEHTLGHIVSEGC